MSDSAQDSPAPRTAAETRLGHDLERPCTTMYSPNLTVLDSLITNSFTLNSGGPRPVATSRRPASTQRQRHPLASLMNLQQQHVAVDEDEMSPRQRPMQKRLLSEDFSLYDAENSRGGGASENSPVIISGSPRTTCSTTSRLTDDEEDEDDDVLLPSADNSPVNFKVLKPQLKVQKSFDDSHQDSNSMDSGYGNNSSSQSTSFRFVQPTGIAPRRLDSGIASPLATSATKRSSFSVFNSCSSQGSLESMEEDYLDLFQLEEEAANGSIPNISSLICGTIKQQQRQQTPERKTPSGLKMRVRRCLMMDDSTTSHAMNTSVDEEDKENCSPAVAAATVVMRSSAGVAVGKSETTTTPKRTNLMMLDANQQQQGKAFKRPEPLLFSPVQSKRYKSEVFSKTMSFSGARTADPRLEAFSFEQKTSSSSSCTVAHHAAVPLQRAVSMNETMIKNALSRSSSDPDLIGDFTKPFCLPHTAGRHNDLRSISVDTMAELVRGNFDASVASFKVIDCRYPYEFEGGHIRNAKNLYTQEQILEELVTPIAGEATLNGGSDSAGKRNILVFHCEFSSERGPKLFRFLRSHDRLCNENAYPALHYPEIYLLDGGYKAFYESHPELCDPINYRMMLDPAYGQEYKTFRAKTKSWNGDNGRATTFKRVKSRSRVML